MLNHRLCRNCLVKKINFSLNIFLSKAVGIDDPLGQRLFKLIENESSSSHEFESVLRQWIATWKSPRRRPRRSLWSLRNGTGRGLLGEIVEKSRADLLISIFRTGCCLPQLVKYDDCNKLQRTLNGGETKQLFLENFSN